MTRVIEATFHLKKLKTPNCIKLMTKHPLHPKLIDAISEYKTCEEAMRDAYDMGREKGHNEMLNEVISWIKENSWKFVEVIPFTEDELILEDEDHEFNHSKFAAHLRKAMYPFPQEDNS